jgi:hypothetical protein
MAIKAVTFQKVVAGVDFTASVISYSYQWGRQSYLDNWNGNQMTITLRNNNNQADIFSINERISCSIIPGHFWVSQITFQDAAGTNASSGSGPSSTATIVCDDWFAKAGRVVVNDKALTQTNTIAQINQFATELANADLEIDTTFTTGQSTASATTYTGTIANRVNLNMNTEKGQIRFVGKKAAFLPRNSISINAAANFVASVDEGGVTILYQDFERRTLGQSFANTVTVQPDGLTPQTGQDPSSFSTYGTVSATTSTVDATTGQALDLANWLSRVQGDPIKVTFATSVSDTGNSVAAFDNWLSLVNNTSFWGLSVHYYKPGVAGIWETTAVLEGVSYSGTPDQNNTTAYFSPYDFYDIFLLDSATQGRLDVNRLGF